MAEVPLEAVKVPVSGGIVDAVPAEAVVKDVAPGAAVDGTSPKIWSTLLKKITCPKFGVIWPLGKLLSTIHAGKQQMGVVANVFIQAGEEAVDIASRNTVDEGVVVYVLELTNGVFISRNAASVMGVDSVEQELADSRRLEAQRQKLLKYAESHSAPKGPLPTEAVVPDDSAKLRRAELENKRLRDKVDDLTRSSEERRSSRTSPAATGEPKVKKIKAVTVSPFSR